MVAHHGQQVFTRTLSLWLALSAALAGAEEVVVSDDGRQIELRDDGTWVQLSRDRFATTRSGLRVRLKPDGTWTVLRDSEAPATVAGLHPVPAAPANDVTLLLDQVRILRRNIERAKSTHSETRMQFQVRIVNETGQALELGTDLAAQLKATTSRGGDYPVIDVQTDTSRVEPGERARLVVTARDAPRWFGVKYLSLEVPAGTLGNMVKRILSKNMDEVQRVEVDSF